MTDFLTNDFPSLQGTLSSQSSQQQHSAGSRMKISSSMQAHWIRVCILTKWLGDLQAFKNLRTADFSDLQAPLYVF